jgi:tetratricopeptide (TPR) repeat protein
MALLLWSAVAVSADEPSPPKKDKEAGPSFSFLTWGKALVATDQFSQAASYLEKEVENRPDSSEAYMLLGKAYWGMGRIKDAKGAWEKAASLEPKYAPLVNARLARLERLQDLVFISNETNAEEQVPSFLVRDTISNYFSRLGFAISPKLSGEFLARLTSSLEALAPPALDEVRKISNADLLILCEALSYLEIQDFREKEVRVTAKVAGRAIDLHRYLTLGSYQTLRTGAGLSLLEASERALKAAAERTAHEMLQQIISKEGLQPLLTIDKSDIVVPKLSLPQGSRISLEVTIHNEGDEEAKDFPVHLQETAPADKDVESQPIDSFQVASLPPLSSATFNLEWEARTPGLRRIVVSIGPDSKSKGHVAGRHQAHQEVLVLSQDEILSSLYRLAFNYAPAGSIDRSLLKAQLRVALDPHDEASLRELLKVATDPEGSFITVIGLGVRPWNIFSEEVAAPMARRAARVDAQNWLALIRKALGKGSFEVGIPTRSQVYGAHIVLEQLMPDGSAMVKIHAPLE